MDVNKNLYKGNEEKAYSENIWINILLIISVTYGYTKYMRHDDGIL